MLSQLLHTDGITLGELRQSAAEFTPELYLASAPYAALLECPAPPRMERVIDAEDSASQHERELRARLAAAQQDRGLPKRRLFFLKPTGKDVVIGRSAGHADTVLPEGTISKRHVRLRHHDGRRWTVTDLESANGSWLEGARLRTGVTTPLLTGQVLRVSKFDCLFLGPEQVWTLIAPRAGGSQLVLPPQGLPVKELIGNLAGMAEETFLGLCPHPFLLQVPTAAVEDLGDEQSDMEGTLPLSRTRIINLQRRTAKLSRALVHYLDAERGSLTLGREGGGCSLILPERSVSKRHAELRRLGERWMVTDLESHNGVWIEGERLDSGLATAIDDGQRLSFSSYQCLFLSPERIWELIRDVIQRRKG